jgi:hypothetical protein
MAGPTLARRLADEIDALQGAHARWMARRGRSTVGLSGLDMPEIGRYVSAWLSGTAPASPREGYPAVLALRFAVDDLKAYYLGAAACVGAPSSRQLGDWRWNDMAAGAAIVKLRALGLASDNERLKVVRGNFMVPAARLAMMG